MPDESNQSPSDEARSLALIGPRGSGKSKISRKIGRRVDMPVFSTDTLIAYEAGGRSIPRLVASEGWAAFRARETAVIEKLSRMENIVIDCGGGALVEAPGDGPGARETYSEHKVALLKSCARIVYLKRDRDWLLEKVKGDSSRPSLSAAREYEEILERRLPWYEKSADFILDMRKYSVEEAIGILLHEFAFLRKRTAGAR